MEGIQSNEKGVLGNPKIAAEEVTNVNLERPASSVKATDTTIPQHLGNTFLGKSSGTLKDFMEDENDSNYLVEEKSHVVGGDLRILKVSVKESSLIYSQSDELSLIQPASLIRKEPEMCCPNVKKMEASSSREIQGFRED
ncbi:hypothetical protein ACOSQ4_012318 [Xanthoceras sorbifolium]